MTERQQITAIINELKSYGVKATRFNDSDSTGTSIKINLGGGRFIMVYSWINGEWEAATYDSMAQMFPSSWEEQQQVGEPEVIGSGIEDLDGVTADPAAVADWVFGEVFVGA